MVQGVVPAGVPPSHQVPDAGDSDAAGLPGQQAEFDAVPATIVTDVVRHRPVPQCTIFTGGGSTSCGTETPAVADTLVAEDFVGHWPGRDVNGPAELAAMIDELRRCSRS
jgi:hypothetical protein